MRSESAQLAQQVDGEGRALQIDVEVAHQSGCDLGADQGLAMEQRLGRLLVRFDNAGRSHQQAYAQAQASIAICELYGMTRDSWLRPHAEIVTE